MFFTGIIQQTFLFDQSFFYRRYAKTEESTVRAIRF